MKHPVQNSHPLDYLPHPAPKARPNAPHPVASATAPSPSPGDAAWAAAEAIRALNHLTLATTGPRSGYEYPNDVDSVIAALIVLAQRLPQALTQASSWLYRQLDQGHLHHDRIHHDRGHLNDAEHAPTTGEAVTALGEQLHAAAALSNDLARLLSAAQAVSSHLSAAR